MYLTNLHFPVMIVIYDSNFSVMMLLVIQGLVGVAHKINLGLNVRYDLKE